MKNYSTFLTFLLCALSISFFTTYTQMNTALDFDDMENDFTQGISNPDPTAVALDPSSIISILLGADILPLLQEEFFKTVARPEIQSLLDYPQLGNQIWVTNKNRIWGCDIFFNQMSKGYFTKNSPKLCSYLNLTGESLINRIECCLDKIRQLFPSPSLSIDVAKILGLFQNIALQQRRIGGMMYHKQRHNDLIWSFEIPLFYLEQNFFLTQDERIAISNEFGNSTAKQEAEFRKKYFVSDKIGVGDCRINIENPIFQNNHFDLNLGGYITLPTAFALHKGLLGSSFDKPSTLPSLTIFETLFALAGDFAQNPSSDIPQIKAFDLIKNFLLDAFNRTASNLLDTPLGNGGHVGIGGFIHSHMPMSALIKRYGAADVHMVNKISCEYLFPATEKRFYISKNKIKDISLDSFKNPDDDPKKAVKDLEFIQQEFVNRFFLIAYDTRVQPGIIVHSNTTFSYQGKRWGWNIGTDTWIQTKDILTTINIPSCPNVLAKNDLDLRKSEPFFAYRGRLCGGINYRITEPTHNLNISLNINDTVFNSGIGKDFVLFFKIESHY